MISSAYKLCRDIMNAEYALRLLNIYPFHSRTATIWSADDTRTCVSLLKGEILTREPVRLRQVESPTGAAVHQGTCGKRSMEWRNVALSEIANKDAIYNSIRTSSKGS